MRKQNKSVQVCDGNGRPERHKARIQLRSNKGVEQIINKMDDDGMVYPLDGHIEEHDYEALKIARRTGSKLKILFWAKTVQIYVTGCYMWADKEDAAYEDDIVRIEADQVYQIKWYSMTIVDTSS